MKDLQLKEIELYQEGLKYKMPNVLLISGDNRNVGKTTLGCRIINGLGTQTRVKAIKVSSHFHPLTPSLEIIKKCADIVITQETDKSYRKDSSRYLQAGASEVFYVQYKDGGLQILAEWILENILPDAPIVCESTGLNKFILPGHAIFISQGYGKNIVAPDNQIIYSNFQPENVVSNITWRNNKWQLQ